MADEPVVVMKFQPVKAGNRAEDKTETIMDGGSMSLWQSKAAARCEGVK